MNVDFSEVYLKEIEKNLYSEDNKNKYTMNTMSLSCDDWAKMSSYKKMNENSKKGKKTNHTFAPNEIKKSVIH